ncbi:hypothetical protein Sinac_7405 [Singulisphaera acidiphila DSM 18658]|uniref:Uncharacterized protein n=1 Tax=Singulisphaera acidiphila (strain ATCC BAA-1392 / DSM 18658 / VKM B-2454 / MOB10) TaxID=886293 RepID=L0DPZ7_SINAD|nr:hypothetical protein Sinac_7405 [Singulisphaera acidiphila DSM 18658]
MMRLASVSMVALAMALFAVPPRRGIARLVMEIYPGARQLVHEFG